MADDTYKPGLQHPPPIDGGTPNSDFFSGNNFHGTVFTGLGSIPGPRAAGDDTYYPGLKHPIGPAPE